MQRLAKRIGQQKIGFAIGLLTAAAFGFWIWINQFAPWDDVRQNYDHWAAVIHKGITTEIEVPAWRIALALPLAGFTIARAIQFGAHKFITRVAGYDRVGH